VQAFNDGRTTPSPIEFIQFPSYEQEFWNVGTSLFNDPTQSNTSLLTTLDKTIQKTKSRHPHRVGSRLVVPRRPPTPIPKNRRAHCC